MGFLSGLILFGTLLGVAPMTSAEVAQVEPILCTVTITAPETSTKVGSEVKLDVVTKNVSDRTIYVAYSTAGRNMKIDVRDSEGNPVSETPFGLKVHGTDPKRAPFAGTVFSMRVPLKPGETSHEQLVLDKEYDLTKPGRYFIRVQRSDILSDTNTVTFVKSNTIILTVLSDTAELETFGLPEIMLASPVLISHDLQTI
jgi:hypothetical protein